MSARTLPVYHGILFVDEMIRGLRRPDDDPLQKRVTRRSSARWAKVKPGDRLWVREVFARSLHGGTVYRADHPDGSRPKKPWYSVGWMSSMVMPRRLSRMLLEVVSVRKEVADQCTNTRTETLDDRGRCALNHCRTGCLLLPEVDDAEARLEGVADRGAYLALWHAINKKKTPPKHVWRIEFKRIDQEAT